MSVTVLSLWFCRKNNCNSFFPYSSWNQHEGILRLLLEHGEMDLGQLIRSRQSSRPLRDDPLLLTFLWQQMLNSVRVGTRNYCIDT